MAMLLQENYVTNHGEEKGVREDSRRLMGPTMRTSRGSN